MDPCQQLTESGRFKENILDFISFIGLTLNECHKKNSGKIVIEEGFLRVAIEFVKTSDDRTLIRNFIQNSYQYWPQINEKKEDFFLKHSNVIFNMIDQNYVNSFKQLFQNNLISEDEKESIWMYVFSLVKISIKYLHLHTVFAKQCKIIENMIVVGNQWGIGKKWFEDNIPRKSKNS